MKKALPFLHRAADRISIRLAVNFGAAKDRLQPAAYVLIPTFMMINAGTEQYLTFITAGQNWPRTWMSFQARSCWSPYRSAYMADAIPTSRRHQHALRKSFISENII
jgi:hypothetical protein